MADSMSGTGATQNEPEHPVLPGSKEARRKTTTLMGIHERDTGAN